MARRTQIYLHQAGVVVIGGFVLRAVGLFLLGIAATRPGVVRWPVSFLVAAGAAAASSCPPAGCARLGCWLR